MKGYVKFVLTDAYARTLTRKEYYEERSMCRRISRKLFTGPAAEARQKVIDEAVSDALVYGQSWTRTAINDDGEIEHSIMKNPLAPR